MGTSRHVRVSRSSAPAANVRPQRPTRVAPPPAVSALDEAAAPLAARPGTGGRARRQGQPAATRSLALLRRPRQDARGGQHRDRPGAGRLVLGAGRHESHGLLSGPVLAGERLSGPAAGQRRSCSLRCACSTLTPAALPERAPLSEDRRTRLAKTPLMITWLVTAA